MVVVRLKHLNSLCPDVEVVNGVGMDYYCSKFILHNSEDVEFLTPKNMWNALHKACIYQDFQVSGTTLRVYGGLPMEIKLFMVPDKNTEFVCYDYSSFSEKENINPAALRKMHLYVVEFMRNNNIPVNKRTLPDNIKNLLSFM